MKNFAQFRMARCERGPDLSSYNGVSMGRWTDEDAKILAELLDGPMSLTMGVARLSELHRMRRFRIGNKVRVQTLNELRRFHSDARDCLRNLKCRKMDAFEDVRNEVERMDHG